MRHRCGWLALSAVLLLPAVHLARDTATVSIGTALIGVDELGRVLVAVDEVPQDGWVDRYVLFTADSRLEGPWSQWIDNARLVLKPDSLSLVARRHPFVVSLALAGAQPQRTVRRHLAESRETLSHHGGLELVSMEGGEAGVLLAELSMDDLSLWPAGLAYDLLDPETRAASCEPDFDCVAGGKTADSCSVTGCPGVPSGCSVSCSDPLSFACCKCSTLLPSALCRCRFCQAL